jgi:hypothetical protein
MKVVASKALVEELSKVEPGDILTAVRIENTGREDLDKLSLVVQTEYSRDGTPIKAMGVLDSFPSDAETPAITITERGARVDYGILRPSEGAVFWARVKDVGDLKVRSDRKGMALLEKSYLDKDGGQDNVPIWALFIVGLGALLLGIVFGEIANRSMLRKIGFDPAEIDQEYRKALKGEK